MFLQLVCETKIVWAGCLAWFNSDDFRLSDVGNAGIERSRVWRLRSRTDRIHSKQITTWLYFFDFVSPSLISLAIESLKKLDLAVSYFSFFPPFLRDQTHFDSRQRFPFGVENLPLNIGGGIKLEY